MRALVLGTLLALVLLGAAAAWVTREPPEPATPATMSVQEAMGGGSTEGYARATAPVPFVFPRDHGPHPGFRTEWWYWTGNLETEDGRAFGFQLTFFRSALAPPDAGPQRESAWATRDVYLAHFTLADVGGGRFHAFERYRRGALSLAGAEGPPLRVWVGDWSARAEAGADFAPVRLAAADGDVALELVLDEGRAPVLQGERGLSQKGPAPGNASHYYSLPRMPARGTVRVGGDTFRVTGAAWMDREWSTSALSEGQVGWDWFALQLSDGTDVMLYRLRRADGTPDAFSAGSVAFPDGRVRRLGVDDVRLDVLQHWDSPRGGARYPAKWRVEIPAEGLALTVTPRLADQELPVSVRYWEGSVAVEGTRQGAGVTGLGYVELTGYAGGPAREDGTTTTRSSSGGR